MIRYSYRKIYPLTIGIVTAYKIGNDTEGDVMNTNTLKVLAEAYAAHRGLTLATVSTYAANDGKFFRSLDEGAGCTLKRAEHLVRWFSDHWPADLTWPSDIPRPRKKKDAA
ncbi:hypothetical protein JQX14_24450 [Sulfitobacter pseudonitzschiae]|uniref:Uncharacterized protein n=1 Tax=Pseudosulfitobacter pseudonitzschiae TaxID=1402135 RepID=A0A9Q2NT01_9RHOB|nr:hypothetical protein [Pseudosulfitobacter pseudonitzschiae]